MKPKVICLTDDSCSDLKKKKIPEMWFGCKILDFEGFG